MMQKTPEYALGLIAAALELRQSHGTYFAACFLVEQGVLREVAIAILVKHGKESIHLPMDIA